MTTSRDTSTSAGRPSPAERRAHGKALRKAVPRSSHADWAPAPDRFDPVALIERQDEDRLAWLVPVRHGRMAESPFAFFRGAAQFMAADLAPTPVSGLAVQLCGDAHLANFGVYGSPERHLVFDLNDFDETLPGPWEWDVKRLATSFTIASQHRGFDDATGRRLTAAAVGHYREAMADFAGRRTLDVWYASLPIEELLDAARPRMTKEQRRSSDRFVRRTRSKDSLQALSKLAEKVDGRYRIKSDPPLLIPMRDLPSDHRAGDLEEQLRQSFDRYRASLPDARRLLLDRFQPVDIALKVVGVGSVGTRCGILLLEGRDEDDPLFLQLKEAGPSVLEEFLPTSTYAEPGQRVVEGQRLMQAASDIFLGWMHGGGTARDYYVRQLHDMKGSADVEDADLDRLLFYARLCGWTLARAHARTGDPIAIAGYLGSGPVFDEGLAAFAERYAEQNRRDYDAFVAAIDAGRLALEHER